ncbi:MAG: radical SAM protein [archaeon]
MVKLDFVALHLTYICKNKCSYCYIGAKEGKKHPPFETIKCLIEKLAGNGVREFFLVGGDPCLYPNLKDVVKLIRKLNSKVYIMSNTLDFGKEINFFIENCDGFQTTVLGHTAEEHDIMVGKKGAYSILVRNIKILNSKGKLVEVAVSVYTRNFDKIFDLTKNLIENEKLKISELIVQRIVPCECAINYKFSLTKKQIPIIFKQLFEVKEKYGLVIDFEDPFPLCVIPKEFRCLQRTICRWGLDKASVFFDGGISRCGADSRSLLGNLFKIKNIQQFWQENPVLVDFRSRKWLPKECLNCEFLEKCGGGCSLSRITDKDHERDILCPFH